MLAAGVVASQAVGHQRAEQRREHRRRQRNDETVDQPIEAAIRKQSGFVMDKRRCRGKPDRWNSQIIVARLYRRVEHPVKRPQYEDQEKAEQEDTSDRHGPASRAADSRDGGHQTGSAFKRRRTSRVTTSAVKIRNSQLPAVACDRWNWVKPTV